MRVLSLPDREATDSVTAGFDTRATSQGASTGGLLPVGFALMLGYALAAWVSLVLSRQPGSIAAIWYANAIAIAVFSARPTRDWPLLSLAVAVANPLANWAWGDDPAAALSFLPANLAEIVAAAWLLQRARDTVYPGDAQRLLKLLVLGGVLPQVLGAMVGAVTVTAGAGVDLHRVWLPWFEGSVIGAMSTLPLAYVIAHDGLRAHRASLLSATLLVMLLLAVGVALLAAALLPYPFVYMLLPLVLAATMLPFVAVALLTVAVSVTSAAALGLGVLVPPPLAAEWHQVFVYMAMAASLVPAQLLGASMAELRASRARLAERTRQLERVNDGLEQFVRIASHDLREPLNTVIQFGGLIEEERGRLTDSGTRYLEAMLAGTRRMRNLLDDVLQYVRVQQSDPGVARTVALGDVLDDVRAALAHRIESTGARVEVSALPLVRGHASLLSLMFQNLIANAIKFMPPERTPVVQVHATIGGGHVHVTVRDNGIGIAPADLTRLFQPFQRLHLRRHYEGTGLGLALVRQIAQAHGGDVQVSSTPGEGTAFTVRLPLARDRTERAAGSAT